MSTHESADAAADRSTGLLVFGILSILQGLFAALMVPFTILTAVALKKLAATDPAAPSGAMMLPSALVYTGVAVAQIWLGVGAIRARRWARALLLVGSSIILVSGLLGLVFMAAFMPRFYAQMPGVAELPAAMVTVMQVVTFGTMLMFYVALPGAYVWFFASPQTRATCERRDPRERWTDRCPLPVLALSLMAAGGAISLPALAAYHWALPCFGAIVSGGAGAAFALVLLLALAGIARGAYRLRPAAWWAALALLLGWAVSTGLTFMRRPLVDYYEAMGVPTEQLAMLAQLPGGWMVGATALWVVAGLGYLLWVRRYFAPPPEVT